MLDLLVIHPGAAHGIYGALGDQLTALEPPVWARLIAGYVRDHGYTVSIIDQETLGLDADAVASLAAAAQARLICVAVYGHQPSGSTQQMVAAGAVCRSLKRYTDTPVIMVGGHVSALPERTLREEACDYICVGEGPVTILGLLRNDLLKDIPGLGRKIKIMQAVGGSLEVCGERYVVNPAAPLLDVSELRGDAWDLLPMDLYRSHNWQKFDNLDGRQPYASIYTSLGCPYKCSFCCINAPFQTNRYRMRDPVEVVSEIKMLHDVYGVKTFKIVDEMFVLNKNHYTSICQGIVDAGFGPDDLNIWAYARVDTVQEDKLTLMRQAGVRWLALGIESSSAYVRDGSNKRMGVTNIEGVVRSIQAAGINVIGNYIYGLPDDDLTTMQETLDLAIELKTEFANFYVAMAYPGSPLYDEAIRENWTLPTTWRGFSQHNDDCRPLDTKHISSAEVLRFRDAAFRTYFSDPSYQDMIQSKFGAETVEHVRGMLDYRLTRKLLQAA